MKRLCLGNNGWVLGLMGGVWLQVLTGAMAAPYGREPGLGSAADVPQLVATLDRAEASLPEKARACQQLSIVGGKEAVAALGRLLTHPQLAAYARTGLEAIPDPAADDVLRASLDTLGGNLLVGVVNSLGVRRDAKAVEPLARLAREPARGAAAEALVALGRIGTPPAMDVVRAALTKDPAELRAAAAEASLVAAEREMSRGRTEVAAVLYEGVRQAAVPAPLQQAGLRGVILARPDAGWPMLLTALKSSDIGARKVAATIAREVPGAAIARGMVEELPKADPTLQVLLLRALEQRGERSAAGPAEALVGAESAEVRLGAIGVLGAAGGVSSVPVLVQAAAAERSPEEAAAAAASLVRLNAEGVDAGVLQSLEKATPAARGRLIGVLGQRRATRATGPLLRYAGDADPGVSRAAFDALAAVAGTGDLPELIRVSMDVKDAGVRNQAERALYAVAVKEAEAGRRSEPLVSALRRGGNAAGRGSLLQVLSMLADPLAAETVAAAYDDADAEVRETALRLLVHWPDARPAARVLGIFKTTANETHRALALQGVVTLATLWKDDPNRPSGGDRRPPREAIQWLAEANAAIRNTAEEKKAILGGLGDLNCAEGLRLLQPYLDDAAVKTEASRACLRAARGLVSAEDKELARPLVEKIRDASEGDLRKEAGEVLKALGAAGPAR